jgi:SHS2 domain-containing protein
MPINEKNFGWEHFHHQADIGVRGFGQKIEIAFEQGAIAMTAVITDPAKINDDLEIHITCQAEDDELLFVAWLNALIYEIATRNMLFSRFQVKIKNHQLNAFAWGEKINIEKHQPTVEVKAATYSGLKVYQDQRGNWIAQCIVDV